MQRTGDYATNRFHHLRDTTPFVAWKLGLPEEVMQMAWCKQIVFIGNKKPTVLEIRPYWEGPELRGSFLDNAYHGRTPEMPKTWTFQFMAGLLPRAVASVRVNVGVTAILVLIALLFG